MTYTRAWAFCTRTLFCWSLSGIFHVLLLHGLKLFFKYSLYLLLLLKLFHKTLLQKLMEILDIFKFVDAALNKAKINKFWKNHFCTPYITYTLPFSKMGYRKSTFTPQPLSIFTPLSTHKEPPCTRASTIATVRAPSSTNLH